MQSAFELGQDTVRQMQEKGNPMDREQIGMCGAYCGVCDWKAKTNCPGCQASKANVFWGECAVAKCCCERSFNHCGLCSELPCDILQQAFDNPEHGDNGERLANLKAWTEGADTFIEIGKFGPKDS